MQSLRWEPAWVAQAPAKGQSDWSRQGEGEWQQCGSEVASGQLVRALCEALGFGKTSVLRTEVVIIGRL